MDTGLENALGLTLTSIARMQRDVSMMLGAKALEAEKVRNWILQHVQAGVFPTQQDHLSTCLEIHEQQVEVIEGLTKMCNGLSRSMKIILHPDQEEER